MIFCHLKVLSDSHFLSSDGDEKLNNDEHRFGTSSPDKNQDEEEIQRTPKSGGEIQFSGLSEIQLKIDTIDKEQSILQRKVKKNEKSR